MAKTSRGCWLIIEKQGSISLKRGDVEVILNGWEQRFSLQFRHSPDILFQAKQLSIPVVNQFGTLNIWGIVGVLTSSDWLGLVSFECKFRTVSTLSKLLSSIPDTVRKTVASAGHLQWPLLEMINAHPPFADFLRIQDEGRSRQYAMAVLTAQRHTQPSNFDPATLVQQIMYQPRLDVLSCHYQGQIRRASLALLGHLGPEPLSFQSYQRLFGMLESQEHLQTFSQDHEYMRTWFGVSQDEHRRIRNNLEANLRTIYAAISRGRNQLPQEQRPTPIPRPCRENIPFPPPPLNVPGLLEAITSSEALREEGQIMDHCVGDYWRNATLQQSCFFQWHGQPRATIELVKCGHYWALGQAKGRKNKALPPATLATIIMLLRDKLGDGFKP